jgi:glycosyltransferase involved in cell wall biosynthesis
LGLKEDAVLIGTAARLIPQKGIDYLIAAAERLVVEFPSLRFIVAGDGPDFDRLQYKIDQKKLGQCFKLLGFRKDMPEVLASIDIFALPTLEEGFSIAALEAMAAEKPIVASRVGGIPEVVSEDVGVLVPPGQVDALYHALRHLILEKAERVRLGLAGRSRVESTFSLRQMVDEHENIYESLTMHERLRDSV